MTCRTRNPLSHPIPDHISIPAIFSITDLHLSRQPSTFQRGARSNPHNQHAPQAAVHPAARAARRPTTPLDTRDQCDSTRIPTSVEYSPCRLPPRKTPSHLPAMGVPASICRTAGSGLRRSDMSAIMRPARMRCWTERPPAIVQPGAWEACVGAPQSTERRYVCSGSNGFKRYIRTFRALLDDSFQVCYLTPVQVRSSSFDVLVCRDLANLRAFLNRSSFSV